MCTVYVSNLCTGTLKLRLFHALIPNNALNKESCFLHHLQCIIHIEEQTKLYTHTRYITLHVHNRMYMYTCTCTCTHVHVHAHMYMYMHTCTCTCTILLHVLIYSFKYIHMYMYILHLLISTLIMG